MKTWLPIILYALYLTFTLAAAAQKRKRAAARKRQQQAQQQQQQPQTAAPVTPQRAAKPASRAVRPAPRTTRPAPPTSFAEEYATLPEVLAAQQPREPQPASAARATTPETGSLAADFDLRQAILYSEILQPKFKAEEEC